MRNDLQLTPWKISKIGTGWVDEFCESIFFIGNGRLGIRGYLSSEPAHRPIQKGVYLAGIFGEGYRRSGDGQQAKGKEQGEQKRE